MPVAKTHGGLITFFLRIAGKEPIQQAEQQRFRANLQQCEEQEKRLDLIIEDISRINASAKKKYEELEILKKDSDRPPKKVNHG
jgi:hypothetical protein